MPFSILYYFDLYKTIWVSQTFLLLQKISLKEDLFWFIVCEVLVQNWLSPLLQACGEVECSGRGPCGSLCLNHDIQEAEGLRSIKELPPSALFYSLEAPPAYCTVLPTIRAGLSTQIITSENSFIDPARCVFS